MNYSDCNTNNYNENMNNYPEDNFPFNDDMDPEKIFEQSKLMAKANLISKYYMELFEKQLEKGVCDDEELTKLYEDLKKLKE